MSVARTVRRKRRQIKLDTRYRPQHSVAQKAGPTGISKGKKA